MPFEQIGVEAVLKGGPAFLSGMKSLDSATRGFGAGATVAGKGAASFGQSMKSVGASVGGIGAAIIGAQLAVLGVGAAFKNTIGATISFDKNMRNVQSIAKLSQTEFKALEKSVIDMAKSGQSAGQDVNTLAKGLYDLYSSGFKGEEALNVLKVAAQGASAGLTSAETSTGVLAAVLNSFGTEAYSAEGAMDILFKTVDQGVISFEELASTLGLAVPVAAAMGVSLEEVGAAVAVMTRNGLDASMSMTSLNGILSAILKPSAEAEALAKKLGLGWNSAAVESKGLVGVLNDMITATDGSVDSMGILLGDARAIRGAMVLAKEGGAEFNQMLGEMENAVGSTARALEEQKKSLSFRWDLLTTQVKTFMVEALLPLVEKMAGFVGKLSDEVIPAIQNFVREFKEGFSELDISDAAGRVGTTLSLLKDGIVVLGGAMRDHKEPIIGGILGIAGALVIMNANPLGATLTITAAAITGLGLAIGIWKKNLDELPPALLSIREKMNLVALAFIGSAKIMLEGASLVGKAFDFLDVTGKLDISADIDKAISKLSELEQSARVDLTSVQVEMTTAEKSAEKMSTGVGTSVDTMAKDVTKASDEAGSGLQNITKHGFELLADLRALGIQIPQEFAASLTTGEPVVKAAAQSIMVGAFAVAKEEAAKFDEIAGVITAAIAQGLANKQPDMVLAGQQLLAGIAAGLSSGAGLAQIGATIQGMADFTVLETMGAFQEDSPSKLFMEIGENLMAGLAIGIDEGTAEAAQAVAEAASAIMAAASEAFDLSAKIGDKGFSGITFPGLSDLRDAFVNAVEIFGRDVHDVSVRAAELAAGFAQAAGDIVGTFGGAIDNFAALEEFAPVLTQHFQPLRDAFNEAVLTFGQDVQDVSVHAAEQVASFVDAASSIVGSIKGGIDNLNALEGYKALLKGNLIGFVSDFITAANHFNDQIQKGGDEIEEAAVTWADRASSMIGVIGDGVSNFAQLRDYSKLSRGHFQAFVADFTYAANEFTAAILTRGMAIEEGAVKWAESASTIVGLISEGVSNLNALKDVRPLMEANLNTFIDGLVIMAETFQQEVERAGIIISESTTNFAGGAGSIVELIGNAIGVFSELPRFGAGAQQNVKVLVGMITLAVREFIRGTKSIQLESIEGAKALSEIGVNIITALGNLSAFVNRGVGVGEYTKIQLQKLTQALVVSVNTFLLGVRKVGQDAANAANTLMDVASKLVESFTALQGVTGTVDISSFSSFVRSVVGVVEEVIDLTAGINLADIARLHMVADAIRALVGAVGGGGGGYGSGGGGGGGGVGVNASGVYMTAVNGWNAPPGWVADGGIDIGPDGGASQRFYNAASGQYGYISETPQGMVFNTAPVGQGGYASPWGGSNTADPYAIPNPGTPTPMDTPSTAWTPEQISDAVGRWIPSFATGGMIHAGSGSLAMLHGDEAIVPVRPGGTITDDRGNPYPGYWRGSDPIPPGWDLDPSSVIAINRYHSRNAAGELVGGTGTRLIGRLIADPSELEVDMPRPPVPGGGGVFNTTIGPFTTISIMP